MKKIWKVIQNCFAINMGYAELLINIALCMVKNAFTMSVQTALRSRAELTMGSVAKGRACVLVPAPRPPAH